MQTKLTDIIRATREGQLAEQIIGKCVHCGFCNATCPTYQLLGDELDGPRGRIYLMKQVLEGKAPTEKTLQHLDRCLTCRNCETTCPSGVEYGKLVDVGRQLVEQLVPRNFSGKLQRTILMAILPRRWLFTPILRTGQIMRGVLPAKLASKIPATQTAGSWPIREHTRKMLLLDGCVQPGIAPNINAAAARVLDRLAIQLIVAPRAGCCGALRTHLNNHEGGMEDARRNIDAWWPLLEAGAEAIVMTASGCGSMVKEYGQQLAHDPAYAQKAQRVSAVTRDISEILSDHIDQPGLATSAVSKNIAYHPPCSLQHAQKITGKVEQVLAAAGINVQRCADSHLCCGSAGTYSILQPELSTALRDQKLLNLHATGAETIVTGNIGCIAHLQTGTTTPVMHWIELLDQALAANPSIAR
jgi:glycolate oxidase iron-sulfur subunit